MGLDEGCVMKIKRLNGTFAMMSGGQLAKSDSCKITQLIFFCNSMLKFATGSVRNGYVLNKLFMN
jgi:hypothetical protein